MSAEEVNVKVAVRCRPLNQREKDLHTTSCVEVNNGVECVLVDPNPDHPRKARRTFVYDHAYGLDTVQDNLYDDLGRPTIDRALDGYNGTIFAYGQTGSGKTYSMRGAEGDPGIIPRMNDELFSHISSAPQHKKYLVMCSYLEIYMDEIHDLLNPSQKQYRIREHPKFGVYVDGLVELVVKSADDINRLLDDGDRVRKVGETKMNRQSSRSHAAFIIKVRCKTLKVDDDGNPIGDGEEEEHIDSEVHSKLNLVDLAGSERVEKTGAVGTRFDEARKINLSLSALGNVIEALASKKSHIPYRDSPLTRILQESLGGNAFTCMIATISPSTDNFPESLSTLEYADRAKRIKNSTKKNEESPDAVISELREEVARLTSLLSGSSGSGDVGITQQQFKEMEAKISDLEMAKQQTWSQMEKQSEKYERERQENLSKQGILDRIKQGIQEKNPEMTRKLNDAKQKRDAVFAECTTLRDQIRDLQAQLQSMGEEFKWMAKNNGFKSDAEKAQKRSAIDQKKQQFEDLKEKFSDKQDQLKTMKREYYRIRQVMMVAEDSQLRKMTQEDERQRMFEENQKLLAGQYEKLQSELEQERQGLRQKMTERSVVSLAEYSALEEQYLKEREDKLYLEQKKNDLEARIEILRENLEDGPVQHDLELEAQQAEHFKVFRRFREVFEEEAKRKEQEYLRLIDTAVNHALFLQQRMVELEDELSGAI